MSMTRSGQLSAEAYGLIDECKCGPEPFFVLVSSIDIGDADAVRSFGKILADLTSARLLRAFRGTHNVADVTADDIQTYVATRLGAGEELDEPPCAGEELSFETTDAGLALLRPEDRPITTT